MDFNSDREKVELFISCRSLKNMDVLSKSDPQVILYSKSDRGQWLENGRTEIIYDNLNPNFSKTFLYDYVFEVQQHIKFDVIDIDGPNKFDFIGSVSTTISHIVGNRNQMIVMDLLDKSNRKTGKIIIRAEKVGTCRETIYLKLRAKNVKDIHFFSKTSPFLRFYKISEDGLKLMIYETEFISSNLSPVFKPMELQLQKLCNGDHLRPIKIELWDHQSSGQHKYIGELNFTVQSLIQENKKEFTFINPSKKNNVGQLFFEQSIVTSKPEFIDYLRGGVHLSLIVAIDFTGSNGVPTRPDSLHAMSNNGQKNQYQQAIQAVGQILLDYDYDKKVPVYGFGAKPKLPNFYSNVALHCFPCNANPQNAEVFGLEGIESVYSQILPHLEFAGPTLFQPIIDETKKIAEYCKNQGSDVYNILLILTDGEINDMDKTITSVVDAAYLPLSIIIIGIGNADFGNMEILDGDKGLYDSSGRKALRDLVQFVPFNKYRGNSIKLAENVLEELPTQLCEYMRLMNIKPKPPQVVDINNLKMTMTLPNSGGNPAENFGKKMINAGFMNKIIDQEFGQNKGNPIPFGVNLNNNYGNISPQANFIPPNQYNNLPQNNFQPLNYNEPFNLGPQQPQLGNRAMQFGQGFMNNFLNNPNNNVSSPAGKYNYQG